MKELTDAQVVVVGLGLMGGSLAGALRGQCATVIGIARRAETIEIALARGIIDSGTTDLSSGVRLADVVVLATPVRTILHLLTTIGSFLPDECLLMDLGSTKAQIVAEMTQLPDHVQPLGGHPMCGREVSGITMANPTLYQGCTFILTPLQRTSAAALSLGCALVEAVGARPLVLDPDCHDRLVAAISHLPYLLACGLVGTAELVASIDAGVWEVVSNGFRDTSRLAASDVTMMLDILLTNQRAVLEALHTCEGQLHCLARLVEAGDEEGLRTVLTTVRDRRVRIR